MGKKFWLWKKFVEYVMLDYGKNFVVLILDM